MHISNWFKHESVAVAMFAIAVSQSMVITTRDSQAEVVSSKSSSIKIGGHGDLIYNIRCWQEGKEIISEAGFEWSTQSVRMPVSESLTFSGVDGHQSQLMIMPIGSAVCQISGREKAR